MHLSNSPVAIKSLLLEKCEAALDAVIAATGEKSTLRDIELSAWSALVALGRALVAVLFGRRCEMATMAEIKARGIKQPDVELQLGPKNQATMTTTFGAVRFPLYTYRERGSGPQRSCVERTPAKRDVLPLWPRCRSSELCLQWEVRLGADHPFRKAQQELTFFTHDAVTLEDNTIASHLVHAACALQRPWLYRKPEDIAAILRERALRDRQTNMPVIYVSCDAHALRRYVDASCTPAWKMANGLRLWCVDRSTGECIHLGGEFTWGDCEHVATIFASLIELGILPVDGCYAPDVNAQLCWLSDGMPWFLERIVPMFSKDMVVILDVFHLLERAGELAKVLFPKPAEAQRWYRQVLDLVTNRDPEEPRRDKQTTRGGPRKTSKRRPFEQQVIEAADRATATAGDAKTGDVLCDLLPLNAKGAKAQRALDEFLQYLASNATRIDYLGYRARGLQIGSGAMESLHRTGSQLRTKRPGAKWLATTSQAIFDWRMLMMSGRWEEFWSQHNLALTMAENWDQDSLEYQLNDAA